MDREDLKSVIINYLQQYNAARIGIFGSYARGEDHEGSDLDLLVTFRDTFGLLQLVRIERELSELTGKKVDLVTDRALKNEFLKHSINRDLQIIFGK